MSMNKKLWSGLFTQPVDEGVAAYTASVHFDHRLWEVDIQGSLAHAHMLAQQGLLSPEELKQIQHGLEIVGQEIRQGEFTWRIELEDIHSNIEARLIELIGYSGKKLHTGRSRNDQVATDMRLWLVKELTHIQQLLRYLQLALVELARSHTETLMPGYTHLQVAQPISFAHHLLAYVEMFKRDEQRMQEIKARTNTLPLGSAALAGTSYPLDRKLVAQLLGMVDEEGGEQICQNSLDAVSDRDFIIEFCAAAGLCMVHISRFSEELVLWLNQNFAFIRLADKYVTGSSIMPQKKNPDVPELARGKTGRVVGHLMAMFTLMKAQPLAYNKDNQEDKEALFDTVDTLTTTLSIFGNLVKDGVSVNAHNMLEALRQGYPTATDLADYLVRKGIPFKDAHESVAKVVKLALEKGCGLEQLALPELQAIDGNIGSDVDEVLDLVSALKRRNSLGGTAPEQVKRQIEEHLFRLLA
ncbi:MAG: argininosuccinate lyase [Gammaproteobacteria bacterium]|nr:argininosuccinate lyase [Gammaproteobacteria bacterium]